MPLKSFKLLPSVYRQVPETMLQDYPRSFDVDMNGKMNSWEAIVIIPFVEEKKVIEEERKLFLEGFELNDSDKFRNSTAFAYHEYCYDSQIEPKVLPSQLRQFKDVVMNLSRQTLVREYENVGSLTFEARLLPHVRQPCPGYPSFKYLSCQDMEVANKYV